MAPSAISPERETGTLTTAFDDTLRFYLNGTKVVLDEIDPEVTLLEYLRGIGLTGTKLGCGEGGCGACTVVISQHNPTTGKIYHASVNACLAPLSSIDGKHVITIEGIGNVKSPHPAQERVARSNGSQCGFCTPGIVMSLYALLRNCEEGGPSEEEVEEAFDGNLCRCTGYRPILDAAQTFSNVAGCGKSKVNGGSGCCMDGENGEFNGAGCCRNGGDKETNGNGQKIKRFTPPGFIEYHPDTELIFPPALKKQELRPLAFGNKRKRWFRPVTVDQLLEIKSVYPDAKIIGGSTETQIEIKFKAMQYPVSVFVGDIPELRQYSFEKDHLEIGGNVTLTDLEHICLEAKKHYGPARSQVFDAMYRQLKYFAGRQIRNVGTPAGNLATASPISDLNPVFVASDSVLVAKSLGKETELPMGQFFKGYRRTSLPSDAIIASIRIPVTQEKGEFFRAYKQAKRKDDDIAIVTSALRIRLNHNGVVAESNLVYGGMAPFTIAAKKANAFLTGKRLAELETLEGAMNALEQDFDLQFGVPGGMASYRKSLALGFFYRFYHDIMLELDETAEEKAADEQAVEELERELSTGTIDSDATSAYAQKIVGKANPHLAALKQTTGEAQYTDDIPPMKNELHACFVLSNKAHAKIKSIDYSAALDVPTVVDILDKKDMPNPDANRWGAPHFQEAFFAEDTIYTAGQPIALVVATNPLRAAEAARAVKVEYEDLPAIFTIEEAIEKESFFQFYREIKKGDTDKAFKECDHVFTGVARMGGQEHFYLETNACLAIPKPEDGEMEIWASTQNCNETQVYAARVLGVPANKVVAKVKRLGGGFGGKETRSVQISTILALAAQKTKRPVRCMLTREEDMVMSGQRHPFLGKWKVGVNKDGKIQAVDLDVFNNGGWSWDLSQAVCERAMTHSDGCYAVPNMFVRGRICKTNTMSNTAFRGFGGPQGMFIAESYMEEVADRLGMPAEDFRRINMYEPDQRTHFNQQITDWHVPLMYKQVEEETEYYKRKEEVAEFNKAHKWRKRGLALIPTKFGISFTALWFNQAGALVHIYHDGSVLVAHGGTEMGQGLHTKMTMIAAEALKVPLDNVFISETATNTVANASATAASASSDLNGYAIWNACEQLNARLAPYREKLGADASMKDLAHAAYFDRVNLSAQGFYKTPEIGYVWGENTGKMFFYFTQGVAAAEVEIDTLTGTWTCRRADVKMDVGRSINPSIDYGQIQGAFVQGMGLFTMEESLWLRNGPQAGNLFTRGPGAYKIPGFRDVPQIFNVTLLRDVEWKELRTIQRSRGVGEPPLFMGSSVFFAIRDALKAARKQYGVQATVGVDDKTDGLLRLESPATPEKIRLACVDPIMERARVVPKEGEKSFFIAI
jgi:xanthine dehydrogenase/oxidase